MIPWSSPSPSYNAMSAPRAVRDVSFPVLLDFLARWLVSSSTGANSGLTGAGPIVIAAVPAQVSNGPASENSTHPLRQLLSLPTNQASTRCVLDEVCDLPRLVVLDKGLVLAQVDLISSLRDLGNPDDPAALSLTRSASH